MGYRFGTFVVDVRGVRLLRDGESVHLEPRALGVLLFLVERPGVLVTKEELIEAVWRGSHVSDSALTRAIARLRHALGDDAHDPTYIETAPTLGYRFVADVERLAELEIAPSGRDAEVSERSPRRRTWVWAALAGATILILGVGLAFLLRLWDRSSGDRGGGPSSRPPRIVVLPFATLGSPEDDYFAEGLTEEITSRLAAVSGLRVISRTSAMQYRENPPAVQQIRQELGADYVLEGTVRWAENGDGADRIRVTPQLIRVSDDSTLWAGSYDRASRDVLGLQSDIAARVVDRLGVTLAARDRSEVKDPLTDHSGAHRLYLKSLASSDLSRDLCDRLPEKLKDLEEAVALDPGFAAAWARLVQLHCLAHLQCPELATEGAERAHAALSRAEALAPESWNVVKARIRVLQRIDRDTTSALRLLQSADARVAGDADLLGTRATLLRRIGRWPEALADFKRAFELDPRSAEAALRLASAYTYLRRYAEADGLYESAFALASDYPYPYQRQALNAWLWRGDLPAARRALELYPAEPPSLLRWAWFWQGVYEGRFTEALERLDEWPGDWIDTDSDISPKTLLAAQAYELLGETAPARAAYEQALESLEKRMAATSPSEKFHRAIGLALAGLGRTEEAIRHGRKATEVYPIDSDPYRGSTDLQSLALVYARLGRLDESLALLDRLLAMPALVSIPFLELDPRWAPVRDHPRFQELRDKYGQTG